MSLVSVPGTPTWLCGYGFQSNHSSKNCRHGSKGERYPTDQANDILAGLASLAHGEITSAFARMSNFLPTASLSVFPLYILPDGMHKGESQSSC